MTTTIPPPSPSAQTSKHIRQTILQCQLSPYTLIDCQVQKVNRTVWSTTKTSGQIAGNIQEDLLRLTVGNLKLIPDSKRRQRRPKGKVKASSQFCKPEDAKEKCLPTYLSLAFPPGEVTLTSPHSPEALVIQPEQLVRMQAGRTQRRETQSPGWINPSSVIKQEGMAPSDFLFVFDTSKQLQFWAISTPINDMVWEFVR